MENIVANIMMDAAGEVNTTFVILRITICPSGAEVTGTTGGTKTESDGGGLLLELGTFILKLFTLILTLMFRRS
jgi:hypothetical protein